MICITHFKAELLHPNCFSALVRINFVRLKLKCGGDFLWGSRRSVDGALLQLKLALFAGLFCFYFAGTSFVKQLHAERNSLICFAPKCWSLLFAFLLKIPAHKLTKDSGGLNVTDSPGQTDLQTPACFHIRFLNDAQNPGRDSKLGHPKIMFIKLTNSLEYLIFL